MAMTIPAARGRGRSQWRCSKVSGVMWVGGEGDDVVLEPGEAEVVASIVLGGRRSSGELGGDATCAVAMWD